MSHETGAHLVLLLAAERGAAASSRPVMLASGVVTRPRARSTAHGSAGAPEPAGAPISMPRMRTGMRSAWSSPSASAKPMTCSMPSSKRMKQRSHLRAGGTRGLLQRLHMQGCELRSGSQCGPRRRCAAAPIGSTP